MPLWGFNKKMLNGLDKFHKGLINEIIKKSKAEVIVLEREKGGRLARIYSLMYIGDFVSFYLAILNNIDPTPVEVIDYLKRKFLDCSVFPRRYGRPSTMPLRNRL